MRWHRWDLNLKHLRSLCPLHCKATKRAGVLFLHLSFTGCASQQKRGQKRKGTRWSSGCGEFWSDPLARCSGRVPQSFPEGATPPKVQNTFGDFTAPYCRWLPDQDLCPEGLCVRQKKLTHYSKAVWGWFWAAENPDRIGDISWREERL